MRKALTSACDDLPSTPYSIHLIEDEGVLLPLTFSPPAAVLPLARCRLVFSALVVGSMSPDFIYFIAAVSGNRFSQSLPGTPFFCVPVGLVVLWLFHAVWKYPLISLFPDHHQERLTLAARDFPFAPARRLVTIIFRWLWEP